MDLCAVQVRQQDLMNQFLESQADPVFFFRCHVILLAVTIDLCAPAEKVEAGSVNIKLQNLELLDKAAGPFFLGVIEDLLGSTLFIDAALVHEKDTVGDRTRKVHLMCDDHHGFPAGGKIPDDRLYFIHHGRVQCAGRLIEKDDLRIHRQRTSDSDALFLPAGQLVRIAQCFICKPYHPQKFHASVIGRLPAHSFQLHRGEHDILNNCHVSEEVKGLENHAHTLPDTIDVTAAVGDFVLPHPDLS